MSIDDDFLTNILTKSYVNILNNVKYIWEYTGIFASKINKINNCLSNFNNLHQFEIIMRFRKKKLINF